MSDFFINLGRKKLIGFGILIAIFLIALPLTLIQVQKQQELRQRAQGADSVRLTLGSHPDTILEGTEFAVPFNLVDPLGRDISGIDVTLEYESGVLELTSFNSNVFFSEIVKDTGVPGKIHFVGFNPTIASNLGSPSIEIGDLTFRAKAQGTGTIDLSNIVVTATNNTEPLEVNMENLRLGSYTIGLSASTIPISTLTPTPKPTLIPTTIPTILPTLTDIPTQVPTVSIPTVTPANVIVQNSPTPTIPTPSPAPFCSLKNKGDADCDNLINLLDLELWRTEFVNELNGIPTQKQSDFNNDGIINIVDFNIWKTSMEDSTLPH